MPNQFPFQIIHGLRTATDRKESASSDRSCDGERIVQQLMGEATDHNLSLILEACQKRLDGLLEDRNRIGRHLHDRVLRPLFAITSYLASNWQTCMHTTSGAVRPQDQSLTQLNVLIRELRRVIRELEEGTIQEFDLLSEMYAMVDSYEPLSKLAIQLIIQSHVLKLLTQEEQREVFNISREAINNCVRHAQATRATIRLDHSKAKIRLAIMDNGVGFSPTETQPRGYGLSNIQNRIKKLGGQLRVRSRKGRGTAIVAEFALEPILTSA